MADYMILLLENEAGQRRLGPSETRSLVEAHTAYLERLKASGAYRDSERLRPSAEGKRIRTGKIEGGPFGEEQSLAGFYLVKADSLEEAVALAEPCPLLPGDALEVRPVLWGDVRAGKSSRQGKTFAFAVLGSAPSEEAWTRVMDRIDASTQDQVREEPFAGGVRLQAPRRGRKIVSRGGKRAVMDGPFLESKEVIGGLFFRRVDDLEEAVRWASGTPFVEYGALEIRELWRS